MRKMNELTGETIARLAQGDSHVFQQVYRMFYPKVFGYSLRFMRDRIWAEEIAQEVFIKLWETRERLDPERSFGAYLFRITRNHALNYLKRMTNEGNLKMHYEQHVLVVNNPTENHMHEIDYEKVAKKAVELLPPKRKMIFKMSRLEGVTHDQIALQLSISKNTIKSQIVKASKFIRQYFHQYYEGPAQPVSG